ncbi:MAG: hypothetical protein RSC51_03745 [Oscillospiraceae bacterium]
MTAKILETDSFLRDIGMHSELWSLGDLIADFRAEMLRGLGGEPSSLRMLPTFISPSAGAQGSASVIAVDAGGTNLRAGLVTFSGGAMETSHLSRLSMPGTGGEISAADFFRSLAEIIAPLTEFSGDIGFCFSFPAEILPNRDGKIICLCKELRVLDVAGRKIGEEIIKNLRAMGVRRELRFTLLNDTVGCLMGGLAENSADFDGVCGMILGTGFNCCYAERGEKITKLPAAHDMIINCEASSFSKARRGQSDFLLDEASENPGTFLFEKMLSGAYHGGVITNTAMLASRAGLLSKAFGAVEKPFTPQEIDDFFRGRGRILPLCSGEDAAVFRRLAEESFQRAAKLVCAVLAALCLHCDGGKTAEKPFLVFAEGTGFQSSLLFRPKLEALLKTEIQEKPARHIKIQPTKNTPLSGAALSAR